MTPRTTDDGPTWPGVPDDERLTARGADEAGRASVATEAELRLPVEQVALAVAFEREPSLTCRVERVAAGREDRPFAFVWVGGTGREAVRDALSADPTVTLRGMLAEREGRWLCDVDFDGVVRLVAAVVTRESGVVRSAVAHDGAWRLHLWYPSRGAVGETVDCLGQFGIDADLTHICETDGDDDMRLTAKQRETVETAYRRGYFEVPREVSLGELAEELDVSHQALSERLRRAQRTLLRFELADRGGAPADD